MVHAATRAHLSGVPYASSRIRPARFLIPALLSGTCSLLDLPVSLLYEITKLLDMRSQSSLYMYSTQLYQKWHLQPPTLDPQWHFSSGVLRQ